MDNYSYSQVTLLPARGKYQSVILKNGKPFGRVVVAASETEVKKLAASAIQQYQGVKKIFKFNYDSHSDCTNNARIKADNIEQAEAEFNKQYGNQVYRLNYVVEE